MVQRLSSLFDADLVHERAARRGGPEPSPGRTSRRPSGRPATPPQAANGVSGAAVIAGVAADTELLEPLRERFAAWQHALETDGLSPATRQPRPAGGRRPVVHRAARPRARSTSRLRAVRSATSCSARRVAAAPRRPRRRAVDRRATRQRPRRAKKSVMSTAPPASSGPRRTGVRRVDRRARRSRPSSSGQAPAA